MHTKGPWVIANVEDEWHEGMDGVIAQSCNQLEIRPARNQKLGDEAADLRLIACAPALLEALKEIVEAADGEGWNQLDPSFKNARAAIAKATGEQS